MHSSGLPEQLLKVPTDRLRPLVEEWLASDEDRSPTRLAESMAARFPDLLASAFMRRLGELRTGRSRYMEFDTADRFLVAIGRVDAWHDELADLYEAEAA